MQLHLPGHPQTSRRDTTLERASYLAGQLPLQNGPRPGQRGYLRQALQLRIASGSADQAIVRDVLTRRHYLAAEMKRKGRRRPFPPMTLLLHYLADLLGFERPGEAAGLVTIRIAPRNCHAIAALGIHPCACLELARAWRADDLGPEVIPHLSSYLVHQVVQRVGRDWFTEKVSKSRTLEAEPAVLVAYSDPAQGHDGATYLAAGATSLGRGVGGKLLFAWGLTDSVRALLRQRRRPS